MAYRHTLTNLSDSTFEILAKDPIGWKEGTYTIKRSEQYRGMFHEYTQKMQFHCLGGGKEFIDNVFAAEDINGRIQYKIEFDCDGGGNFEELFTGVLDLGGYKGNNTYTEVNVEKSNLLTKLLNRTEIAVDLESSQSIGGATITPATTQIISLSPVEIDFKSKWIIESPYEHEAQALKGDPSSGTDGAQFQPRMAMQQGDFTTSNQYPEQSNMGNVVGQIFYGTSNSPFVEFNDLGVDYPLTVNWSIDISGAIIDSVPTGSRDIVFYKLYLVYGDFSFSTGMPPTRIELYNSGPSSANPATFVFNVIDSGTISINPGDKMTLAWVVDWDGDGSERTQNVKFQYDDSFFEINSKTIFRQTDCKTVMVHEAFNQVVDAIADSDGNFYSEFYGRTDSDKEDYAEDGKGSHLTITNGLNIRAFEDKPIFCSLDQLFDSLDCLHNIGMGEVNGKIRVEPLGFFFDPNTVILSLPYAPNIEVTTAIKRYINKIEIGYQRWESEFKNGLDEPCAKHEYSTIIDGAQNTYIKLCYYIASTYAWELTRRKNALTFPTTDFTYDNDNFFLSLVRSPVGSALGWLPELYDDSFNTGTGMASLATAYNLRLTPKRMLLAHLNNITGGLQTIQGDIRFTKGEGNTDLQVAMNDAGVYQEDYNGQVLAESASIAWNDSDAENIVPLFVPRIYSFEYPIKYSEFKAIKANPYGLVEFYEFADQVKTGFILSMEYEMEGGLTKFQLIGLQ